MVVERVGMLGVSVRKMKALAVKMETVTVVKVDNLTRYVYYIYAVNSKIFFLADILYIWT